MFNNNSDRYETVTNLNQKSQAIDEGLRNYMLKIYNYMAIGIAITGVMAYLFSKEPLISLLFNIDANGYIVGRTVFGFIVPFIPLAMVLFMHPMIGSLNSQKAQMFFWIYAAFMGIGSSYIFLTYTGMSIARVFFITAATFGGMSLYGYTTKTDLTGMGAFLFMGLWGILIAAIVNLFLQSPVIYFATSAIAVLVFTGLTAYDTQKIRRSYNGQDSAELANTKAIVGALELYMDFIFLFLNLLTFFGNRD